MKKIAWIALVASVMIGCSGGGAKESSYLKRVWVSGGSSLSVPESVVYDQAHNRLYVSNVNSGASGNPWQDNKGFISSLDSSGEVQVLHWVDGLKAPKGLALDGKMLYVADLNEVVKIDTENAKIIRRYRAPQGVERLNDIVYDANRSRLYVSDSKTKVIYALDEKNGKFTELYPKEQDPKAEQNGLCLNQDQLIMQGSVGYLKSLGLKDHHIRNLSSTLEVPIDGVTTYHDRGYLVSSWVGEIYHVSKNGTVLSLLKSKPSRSADIFYAPMLDLLLVPDFDAHIIAYKVKNIK